MKHRRLVPFVLALIVALGLLPLSPASAAFNRAPKIKKAVMKDTDGDGMANKVVLTYTERINHKLDTSRFPFKVDGYRIMKVNAARRSTRLVIVVKESSTAPAKPASIRYSRTRQQPVKDLKRKQAAKQLLTRNIIGLAATPPPAVEHTLTVQKGGSGTGSVTSNPAGINCGTVCTADYAEGTSVTLSAVPGEGAAPEVSWTGCATNPTPASCTVTMDAAKTVGATFTAAGQQTLSVSKEGSGSVASTSTPTQATQINCSATCASTTASYPENALVRLTATPGQTGMLITWGGDCSGTGTTCDLVMDGPKQVTVKFELPTLVVTRVGSGTVTSSPAGIDCGSDCTGEFAKDADVTLAAAPADGYEFTGWSDDATCADSATCVVRMTESKTVTATFELIPSSYDLSVTWDATKGSVTCSTSAGPSSCNAAYAPGTDVTITAVPLVPNISAQLSGACSTAALPVATCTVSVDGPTAVTASFGTTTTTTDTTTDGGIITVPDTGGLL